MGELMPSLEWLRQRGGCTRILGLRDIIDEPAAVVALWEKTGIYRVLQDHYDHVVVYGNARFYDPVASYRLPPAVAAKTQFLDFVCNTGDGERPGDDTSAPARE